MERPPSLNDFLAERQETPELIHEWEVVLMAFQRWAKEQREQ